MPPAPITYQKDPSEQPLLNNMDQIDQRRITVHRIKCEQCGFEGEPRTTTALAKSTKCLCCALTFCCCCCLALLCADKTTTSCCQSCGFKFKN